MNQAVPSFGWRFFALIRGFCLGAFFAGFCLVLALGMMTFPVVGWASAVGFATLALISPFVGAWMGYRGAGMTMVDGGKRH